MYGRLRHLADYDTFKLDLTDKTPYVMHIYCTDMFDGEVMRS